MAECKVHSRQTTVAQQRQNAARDLDDMSNSRLPRRSFLIGAFGLAVLGAAGCGTSTSTASGSASTGATTASSSSAATSAASGGVDVPALTTLVSEVAPKFKQATYADATTGKSLPYNIYLPDGYDSSKTYPLVLFITDSTLVGQAVTAPLSQYGALIWASSLEQAKHKSIVLAPEYPEIIIDDRNGHTTTPYVEMTARLVKAVAAKYSVDPKRVYGTGQSMGCLTTLLLAAEHPDLFAAELFVSGQWDISQLQGLTKQKFFYITAAGDPNAPAGQVAVEKLLKTVGVPYQTATWDATWSASKTAGAAASLFAAGDSANFATFTAGTVLKVASDSGTTPSGGAMGSPAAGMTPPSGMAGAPSGAAQPSGGGMSSGIQEHLASFEPAYKITAVRDWLFAQTA